MLNLTFVRSFVALAETGSFRAAAEQLDIAQPTISQHLRKLEASLGVQLVERSHVHSRPTRQGRLALPVARSLLATADRMRGVLAQDTLVIGASGNIAAYFLPRALGRFEAAEGPLPVWRIVSAPNPEIVDRLSAGEIDVAATEWPPDLSGISTAPWRTEEMVVILPPDHPLAGHDVISVEAFARLPLIGGESGSGTATLLSEALGDTADQLRIAATAGSTEAVKAAVREGLGASIVLRGAVEAEIAAGQLAAATLHGVRLSKTFYVSHASSLPETAWPVRLAGALTGGR